MPSLRSEGTVNILTLGTDENRLSTANLDQINSLLDEILAKEDPAALVITGTDKFFSNGLDVEFVGAGIDKLGGYIAEVQKLLARLLTLPLPTVASINGHAFGAGAMIALACDYRVMRAERGFFCLPEVDLGMPFTPGMAALCQGKMSARAASATMPSGRRLGGLECRDYGIVDAAVAEDELHSTAHGYVSGLAGKNRAALGAVKNGMYASIVPPLLAGLGA